MAFSIYLLLGFFYNVRFKDMPPDLHAIPHVQVATEAAALPQNATRC